MDISVAIGRKVGETDMPLRQWTRYVIDTRLAIEESGFTVIGAEMGHAYGYDYQNGESEETQRYFAKVDDSDAPRAYLLLRDKLDTLRKANDQWGIALSLVKTDMVSA